MSEYWKSTPKYWCKHCSTFVRDTKLEKANHEATPKHQGNLKRFLRDLHRGHENDQKNKERAKAEVARLNGVVAGESAHASAASSNSKSSAYTKSQAPRPQATAAQRKQQLAQLAEMGVAIPDEFRPDMAMAGEWQVTSETVIEECDGERKPDALALGVRKRPTDDEEEEVVETKKRRWGSTYKAHPGDEVIGDLDELLTKATRKGQEGKLDENLKNEVHSDVKLEAQTEVSVKAEPTSGLWEAQEEAPNIDIKAEPFDGATNVGGVDSKGNDPENSAGAGIIFKKRKAKNIRSK